MGFLPGWLNWKMQNPSRILHVRLGLSALCRARKSSVIIRSATEGLSISWIRSGYDVSGGELMYATIRGCCGFLCNNCLAYKENIHSYSDRQRVRVVFQKLF